MQSNYIQEKSSALLLTASYLYSNNHKECEQQSEFDFSMKIIIITPHSITSLGKCKWATAFLQNDVFVPLTLDCFIFLWEADHHGVHVIDRWHFFF